jgi:putative nucleotidyltransferase with HDIG domain
VIPELEIGYGVSQNKHHIYDCYQHNLLTLDYAAKKNFNLHVRLAGLLHDIAKPHVKVGEGEDATFYNHEVVGAKMTQKILERLKFPKKEIEKIVILVRFHLFYYNVGEVSESSVRRLVRQVGIENMDDLIKLRMADRVGSGVPKAEPYKLRHLKYLIEKTSSDPISTKMLAIDGAEIMRLLKIDSGPKVGKVLSILLSEVLSNPENNDVDKLRTKVEWLGSINEKELDSLSDKAKREIDEIETKRDEMTKRKYWVT